MSQIRKEVEGRNLKCTRIKQVCVCMGEEELTEHVVVLVEPQRRHDEEDLNEARSEG